MPIKPAFFLLAPQETYEVLLHLVVPQVIEEGSLTDVKYVAIMMVDAVILALVLFRMERAEDRAVLVIIYEITAYPSQTEILVAVHELDERLVVTPMMMELKSVLGYSLGYGLLVLEVMATAAETADPAKLTEA